MVQGAMEPCLAHKDGATFLLPESSWSRPQSHSLLWLWRHPEGRSPRVTARVILTQGQGLTLWELGRPAGTGLIRETRMEQPQVTTCPESPHWCRTRLLAADHALCSS